MEEQNIRLNDEEKLRKLGFQDGFERAMRIIQNDPENLQYLDIVKLPIYYESYMEGVEEAKKQMGIIPTDTPAQK